MSKFKRFGSDLLFVFHFCTRIEQLLRVTRRLAVKIVFRIAFADKFFRKSLCLGVFALCEVVDFILFANLLALCNHLALVDECEEACKEQEHSACDRTEYDYVVFKALTEQHHRVNQERYRTAYTAAKIDDCVGLRA